MPPKKKTPKVASDHEANGLPELPKTETTEPPKDEAQPAEGDLNKATANDQADDKPKASVKPSKKRKNDAEPKVPSKASRRSGRGGTKPEPSKEQLLNFLLGDKAEELIRPEDEQKDVKERGNIKTYSSSVLNPFEELMSAIILSRPISHRLGLRSIRTVLNDPYNFSSAKAVKEAGNEKRHQALWDAKTQHKGKTADQLGLLADVVLEKFTSDDDKEGTKLSKLLTDNGNDLDKSLSALKDSIKGLGSTGVDIFLRRVQWLWEDGYPYIDGRSQDSLRRMGLTQDAEELQELVEQHWKKLETKHLAGQGEAEKKRRAFVVLLERATGADLEDKIDQVLEAAASA